MLLTIAASISFTIWFVTIAQLHRVLRIDFKPFSCVPCLSVWVFIAFTLLPSYITLIAFGATFASTVATLIQIKLDRWN